MNSQFLEPHQSLELHSGWQVKDFEPGQTTLEAVMGDSSDWLDIAVPGDVHCALVAAGRLADPFFDGQDDDAAWVTTREWWYRLRFKREAGVGIAPNTRTRLVFHGLDTYATIYLNGLRIGSSSNMFREVSFDVTAHLVAGSNCLMVVFERPEDHLEPEAKVSWSLFNADRPQWRKAQYGFGWDWGPNLPTVGIWRGVELRDEREAVLSGVHFYTQEIDLERQTALVSLKLEVERFAANSPLRAFVQLIAPNTEITERWLAFRHIGATARASLHLELEQPELWWTHELGTPALYTLRVTLERQSLEGHWTTLEVREQRVGVRTVALDQSPDPIERGARFFRFVLNGVPIFAKGACWIPADSFPGRLTPSRYAALVSAARDANMTMLRVWGGGIYEHDAFYECCDEQGILVWQDFMFSCAAYPETPAMIREVELEAAYQVRRLRSHPCLALWCGNNESQWIHDIEYGHTDPDSVPGALYYDCILPSAVASFDGRTPYWAGSPLGGSDDNSHLEGDRHNWQVWHGNQPRLFGERLVQDTSPAGVSFHHYEHDLGRFISEFGMHAAPSLETLRRVTPADQLYHHSPSLDHRNKDQPKNKGDHLMLPVTGLPENLEQYVMYSQYAQAEGLRVAIEHYRRRKPHCSGTLIWQFNDCWPALSWSLVDFYGTTKGAYDFVKRAYTPILVSVNINPGSELELWITNDLLSPYTDDLTLTWARFSGEQIAEETLRLSAAANSSRAVTRLAFPHGANLKDTYLKIHSSSAAFATAYRFFAPIKNLELRATTLHASATSVSAHEARVEVFAADFARFVHLSTTQRGVRFDDQFFDLEPKAKRVIRVWCDAEPLDLNALGVNGYGCAQHQPVITHAHITAERITPDQQIPALRTV